MPSQAFMVNYIVDDLDALLERLQKDDNKIELWQPLTLKKT